jgi:hypothetical protein
MRKSYPALKAGSWSVKMAKINGPYLVASVQEAKKILKRLKKDLKNNEELLLRARRDVYAVLGERGLSIPIQIQFDQERLGVAQCALVTQCLCTNCGGGVGGPFSISTI